MLKACSKVQDRCSFPGPESRPYHADSLVLKCPNNYSKPKKVIVNYCFKPVCVFSSWPQVQGVVQLSAG